MTQASITDSQSTASSASVVALAGHVDHGKTALVYAMTSIMTARRHEQACGMTQNLGFAHFQSDQGKRIGVIDVPGHERYIRNMVAGLWSIDLVLLVVAANEGWMPMTQAHLEVAEAMSQARVLVCITKADLVDEQRLAELEDECLQRVLDTCEQIPEVICVSAHTGQNIDSLKRLITDQLALDCGQEVCEHEEQSTTAADRNCHLYVDRSFSVTGVGTVVTGTLVGGELAVGDRMTLQPSKQQVKVRNLQSYNRPVDRVSGSCRVAVGVKGVNYRSIGRGDCLTTCAEWQRPARELVVRLNRSNTRLKSAQVEVAIGSWNGLAQMIPISDTQLVRLQLQQDVSGYFGQPLAIIQQGGSKLIAGGRIVWLEATQRWQRRSLYRLLNQLTRDFDAPDYYRLQLELHGLIDKQSYDPTQASELAKALPLIETASHYLLQSTVEQAQSQIATLLAQPAAAISTVEFCSRLRLDKVIVEQALQQLKQDGEIHLSYQTWVAGQGQSEDDLCPSSQALLTKVRQAERTGVVADKELIGLDKKLIKNLARLKYVTLLDDSIYYDSQLYDQLVQDVLADCRVNQRLSMAHIKDRSQLSRKYSIPLANRMERDGWVRRVENDRVVLKCL
ncbi:selenocysteine-specific translation elongation factor [Paraferrimonas sedimenticola]|uniref:Selenocysteine-specific elongation factor n=1 Tax=Paraferrimonas sedimenticola TaxID=375674 RepID=A0AA37RY01_9GAMM|nr:selenocysteine-specific translation elongation factor [Paraferrimonas sedimenticola]GLP97320.1 selenocysteine-specific translation elongation factor [Paraferrimonas sedimenticola]